MYGGYCHDDDDDDDQSVPEKKFLPLNKIDD